MEHDARVRQSRKRKRWTLAIVLILAAVSLGAIAARRTWRRDAGQDPQRLGLLYEAWKAFDAKHQAAAIELLDRRAAEVAPSSLDWMLRGRIAEAQGSRAALGFLDPSPTPTPHSACSMKHGKRSTRSTRPKRSNSWTAARPRSRPVRWTGCSAGGLPRRRESRKTPWDSSITSPIPTRSAPRPGSRPGRSSWRVVTPGRPRRPIAARWSSTRARSRRIASWPTSTPCNAGRRSATRSTTSWPGGRTSTTSWHSPGARIPASSGIRGRHGKSSPVSSPRIPQTAPRGWRWRRATS